MYLITKILFFLIIFYLSISASDDFNIETDINEQIINTAIDENSTLIAPDIIIQSKKNIQQMRIAIVKNYMKNEDELFYNNSVSEITGDWNKSKGILTLSGDSSDKNYQKAIRTIEYQNSSENPTVGKRDILIYLSNGKYYNIDNKHYYEKQCGDNIKWTESKIQAENSTFFDLHGYLATITEDSENSFIQEKVKGDYAWIGATDADVEGIWRWVTGPEGLEDNGKGRHFFTQDSHRRNKCPCNNEKNLATDSCKTYADENGDPLLDKDGGGYSINNEYNYWGKNEPNSWTCDEDYGHFYIRQTWNDYPNKLNVKCLIVEYGDMPNDSKEIEDTRESESVRIVADSISDELDYICSFTSALSVFESKEYVDLGGGKCNTRIEYFGSNSADKGLNVANNKIYQPTDCQKICNEKSCDSSNSFAVPINLPTFPKNSATRDKTFQNNKKYTLRTSKKKERNLDKIVVRNGAELYFEQNSKYDFQIKNLEIYSCNGKGVTFEPGNYFIENFHHSSRCNIYVKGNGDNSGTARLFIKNGLHLKSNAEINWNGSKENSDASKLMFISYDDVQIDSDVKMAGLTYTKDNIVTLKSGAVYSGAITAHRIIVEDRVKVYSTDLTSNKCENYSIKKKNISNTIFDVRDLNIPDDNNFSITTKVINKPFGLEVVAFNDKRERKKFTGTIFLKTFPFDLPLGSCKFENSETCITDNNLTIPIGLKSSKIIITNNNQDFNSSDNFAIRPKKFFINYIPSPQIADINFSINISLQDEVLNPVTYNYNEKISDLNLTVIEKEGCIDKELIGLSGGRFQNGVLQKIVNYPEVGKVKIYIGEIDNKEFAKIDKKDTNNKDRFIEPADINVTFDIAKYRVSGTLKDFYLDKNFTFYSSDLKMSAKFPIKIESIGGDGNITLNYDKNCFERNLSQLRLFFDWNQSINNSLIGNQELNISNNLNRVELKNLPFENGIFFKTLSLNLDRNVTVPKNSDILKFKYFIGEFDNYQQEGNFSGLAHFYYGRLQAPNYRFKGNSGKINFYSEIYSNHKIRDNLVFGNRFIDLKELQFTTSSTSSKVSIFNNKKVFYYGNYFPYNQLLAINSFSWLIYNSFVEQANQNFFTVSFYDDNITKTEIEKIKTIIKQESAKYKDRRIEW